MKTIKRRVYIVAVLTFVFIAAASVLVFSLITNADNYALKNANEHLFSYGTIADGGDIKDRYGNLLAYSENGERFYSDDKDIRTSLLHILGDDNGFIEYGLQSTFRKELSGYTLLFGVNKDDNNNMTLTLDSDLCAYAYNALGDYKGAVGIVNYKTAEILCAVSKPSYDILDKPDDIESDKTGKYDGIYINRLFNGLYVPGSVFKTVTALGAVDNIPDIMTRTFFCDGIYETKDGKVICNDDHGTVNFEKALNRSCNSAFAEIAIKLGPELLTSAFKKAGLSNSYSVDRIETSSSRISLDTYIADVDLGWAGIGQYTTLVNPYSLLVYMSALGNGGKTDIPYLVESIISDKGNVVYTQQKTDSGIYIEPSDAKIMKELLRSDVSEYYGDYYFGDLKLCAKSGTAEVDDGKKPHSWFAGFSYDDDFPYAFVCIMENAGSGLNYAGQTVSDILQYLENK